MQPTIADSLGVQPTSPDAFINPDASSAGDLLGALTPQHYDLLDSIASSQNPGPVLDSAWNQAVAGVPPARQIQNAAKADNLDALGGFMQYMQQAQKGNDAAYQTAISRLNEMLGEAPAVPKVPELQQPNALQTGLAGLGAVLDPWHAASDAATPFQSNLQMQSVNWDRENRQYELQRQNWQDQLQQVEHIAAMANQAREAGMNHLAQLLQHQATMASLQIYRQGQQYDRDTRAFSQVWDNPRASVDELKALTHRFPTMGLGEDNAVSQWQNLHSEQAKKDWETELSRYRNWAGFLSPADADRLETQRQGLLSKYGFDDSDLEKPVSEAGMRKQMMDQNLSEFNQRFGLQNAKFNEQLATDKAKRDLEQQKLQIAQAHLQIAQGGYGEKLAMDNWKQQVEAFNAAERKYDDTIRNAIATGKFKDHEAYLNGESSPPVELPTPEQPSAPEPSSGMSGSIGSGAVKPFDIGIGAPLPGILPNSTSVNADKPKAMPPLMFNFPKGTNIEDPVLKNIVQRAIQNYNQVGNPAMKKQFEKRALDLWNKYLSTPINHAG